MKKYFLALSTFAGTTIGVGLFGLPYAAAQAGFWPMLFYFFFLGLIMILVNLALGEICLRTPNQHRMPGYAEIYFGKKTKLLSMASGMVGLYVGMVAYIVVGGIFLNNLLNPIIGGNVLVYSLIIFTSASFIIFLGSNTIAKSELISVIIFFLILIYFFIIGGDHIRPDNFQTFDIKNIFLPYGIILFSLAGASAIPEARELLGNKANLLKSVIVVGTLIPIITYILFIILVLGITGPATTDAALTGLKITLGEKALIAGFIFGLFTTFTSYISVGLTLKKMFWYDFKFNHFTAWIWATMVPIILFFAGLNNFILIAAFSGAVTMGIDSILIFLVYLKAKKIGKRQPEYNLKLSKVAIYPIILILLIGIILGTIPK